MPEDFLKQLNSRPKVPPRTEEPVDVNPETSTSRYPDTKNKGIVTIRSSLLMEESMHKKFRGRCNEGDIIRACWLEAALILAEKDPELMKKIEDLAKELTALRKEEADDRRRVTMFENRKK